MAKTYYQGIVVRSHGLPMRTTVEMDGVIPDLDGKRVEIKVLPPTDEEIGRRFREALIGRRTNELRDYVRRADYPRLAELIEELS